MKRTIRILGAVLMAAVLITGCGGRRSEQARQMGDVYLENKNYDQASIQYKAALESDPQNARADLGLAKIAAARGDLAAAGDGFERAIEKDASLVEAYVHGVRAYLASDDVAKAADLAERLRAQNEEQGGLLRAAVYRANDETDEAQSLLESLREEYPENVGIRVQLARLYTANNNPDAAEAELRAALEKTPNALTPRMALIDVYRSQGRLGDIETELRQSIEAIDGDDEVRNPQARGLRVQLAMVLLEQGQTDAALTMSTALAEEAPEQPWVQFVYGNSLVANGKREEGLQALQLAATGLPDVPEVAEQLARVQQGQGGVRTATPSAESGSGAPSQTSAAAAGQPPAISVDDTDWQKLWNSASLQQLLRNRDKYAGETDPLLPEILALAAMFTGNGEATRELLANVPESSLLPKLHERMAERDAESAMEIVDAWQENDARRAVLSTNARGFIYAMVGLRARALQIFLRATQAYPENGVALYNTATMYNTAGMHEFAARALERLLERAPNALEVRMLLYQTQKRAGLDDAALATAEISYGLFPNQRETIINLAYAYMDAGEPTLARQVMRRAVTIMPDDSSLRGTSALVHIRSGDLEAGAAELDSMEFEGDERARAVELRAFCHGVAGEWEKAAEVLSPIDETELSSGGALTKVATLIATDEKAEAARAIAKAAERLPAVRNSSQILIAALGEATSEPSDEARGLVEKLADDSDAAAQFAMASAAMMFKVYRTAYDLTVDVEKKTGLQPPLAMIMLTALAAPESYEDRVARAEAIGSRYDGAYVYPGIAAVMAVAGDTSQPWQTLKESVQKYPESIDLWRALAFRAELDGEMSEAVAAFKKIIDLGGGSGTVYNNYAYALLQTGGDTGEALTYARRGVDELKNQPLALHTLGVALLAENQPEEALKNLGLAAQMLPGSPTILLDLGRALIAGGDQERGESLIESAIRNADVLGLDFERRAEAEAILGSGD